METNDPIDPNEPVAGEDQPQNHDQPVEGAVVENTVPVENMEVSPEPEVVTPDEPAVEPVVTEEPEVIDPVIPENTAPGTGIDTDGDGVAELVTQQEGEEPVHVDSPDDYVNKVKLGVGPGNVIPKSTATKLINASQINDHYKDIMKQQVSDGEFNPPYDETFKRIKAAYDGGTVYRPGADGL